MISKATVAAVLTLSFCILLLLATAMGEKDKPAPRLGSDASCGDCHVCSTPTADAPCLRQCPRFSKAIVAHSPEEGPSLVILDQLSDL